MTPTDAHMIAAMSARDEDAEKMSAIASAARAQRLAGAPMCSDEAMAVMFYLQNARRSEREDKIFNEAWGVICQIAREVIAGHTTPHPQRDT